MYEICRPFIGRFVPFIVRRISAPAVDRRCNHYKTLAILQLVSAAMPTLRTAMTVEASVRSQMATSPVGLFHAYSGRLRARRDQRDARPSARGRRPFERAQNTGQSI
jgi:hypothetical protein